MHAYCATLLVFFLRLTVRSTFATEFFPARPIICDAEGDPISEQELVDRRTPPSLVGVRIYAPPDCVMKTKVKLSIDDDQKFLKYAAQGQTCRGLGDASSLNVDREGEISYKKGATPLGDDFEHIGTEIRVTDTGSPPLSASFSLYYARSEAPIVESIFDHWHTPGNTSRMKFMIPSEKASRSEAAARCAAEGATLISLDPGHPGYAFAYEQFDTTAFIWSDMEVSTETQGESAGHHRRRRHHHGSEASHAESHVISCSRKSPSSDATTFYADHRRGCQCAMARIQLAEVPDNDFQLYFPYSCHLQLHYICQKDA